MNKFLTALLALVLCVCLVACNGKPEPDKKEDDTTTSNDEDTTPTVDPNAIYGGDYFDYDLAPFVNVPAISSLTVPKSLVDQLLELKTALTLSSLQSFSEVSADDLTKKYDTVNIDYKGRPKDEKAEVSDEVMKGMEYKGYDIMIGSGSFIGRYDHPTNDSLDTEGFEDQMIGMKVGQTKELLVTFPDNYGETTLAGMQVIFEVTINSAKRPKPIDDEIAKKQGYENVEAFNEELLRLTKSQAAMEFVYRSSEIIEYPAGDLELLTDYYIDSYIDYYYGSGISNEDADRIRAELAESADQWAKDYAKERMILKRITDMHGVTVTEKTLADYAQKEAENSGIGSGDTLIAYYGKDVIYTEYLYTLAVEVVDNNIVFEN